MGNATSAEGEDDPLAQTLVSGRTYPLIKSRTQLNTLFLHYRMLKGMGAWQVRHITHKCCLNCYQMIIVCVPGPSFPPFLEENLLEFAPMFCSESLHKALLAIKYVLCVSQ